MMDRSNFKYHIPCLVTDQRDGIMQTYLIIGDKYYNKFQFLDSNEILYIINEFPVTNINYDLLQSNRGYEGTFYVNSDLILYDNDGFVNLLNDTTTSDKYKEEIEVLQSENNILTEENSNLKNELERYQEFSKIAYIKPRCSNYLFIDIFRISSDGKYLEIDMSCDDNYSFESIFIKEYKSDKIYDLSEHIDDDSTRQMFRVNLNELNGPSMYYANVSIKLKNGAYYDIIDSEQNVEIATSDISNVYFYILKELLCVSNYDQCGNKISSELQRIFVLLFAHLEAMRLERFKEAEMFYTIIKNNFSNCQSNIELKSNKTCCCHGQIR